MLNLFGFNFLRRFRKDFHGVVRNLCGLFVILVSVLTFAGYGEADTYFITENGSGNGDGLSWENAGGLDKLQTLMGTGSGKAESGDTVFVAGGTYNMKGSLTLNKGVKVYGGFAGTETDINETAIADRDFTANVTIISRDASLNDDNKFSLITCSGNGATSQDTRLDGFTLTGGKAENGGAMYIYDNASPAVTNCSFSGNTANNGSGGAMLIENNANPIITNCAFNGNQAYLGGAMYIYNASPTITNCSFSGNTVNNGDGGAMYIPNASPTITNCTFNGNTANQRGGAMDIYDNASPAITNCTFNGNNANDYGGAMYIFVNASPTITNCTLTDNKANNNGDEIYVSNNCTADLFNTIVNGSIDREDNGTINATNCALSDTSSVNGTTNISTVGWTPASKDVTVNGVKHTVFIPSENFIGKGTSSYNVGNDTRNAPATDQTGRKRNADSPTIGALERDFALFIKENGDGNGLSWESAGGIEKLKTFMGTGDEKAQNGDTIYVSAGTYKLTGSLTLNKGVKVYGGFKGDETNITEETIANRDIAGNKTIISRDVGAGDFSLIKCENNGATSQDTRLDGFTLTGGNANGSGGAMWIGNASPAITNCSFNDNTAANIGGAMVIYDNASPAITNCSFNDNNASNFGGAMYIFDNASPTITNCTFNGNNADGGGAMWIGNASPAITNCSFSGNNANFNGGAMYIFDNASPTITNCTLTGNKANNNGNEIYVDGGTATANLVNTIVNGSVDKYNNNGKINATNCALSDTSAVNGTINTANITTNGWTPVSKDVTINGVKHTVFIPSESFIGKGKGGDNIPATDQLGRKRNTSNPTIGALEGVYFVTAVGSDDKDGSSWENAVDLETAVKNGGVIFVAKGTHKLKGSLTLNKGVKVYGGFAGTETNITEETIANRDIAGNKTIISRDVGAGDFSLIECNSNGATSQDTRLDGFTLTGGNANGSGGAMYIVNNASPAITNCTFDGNTANYGGAMNGKGGAMFIQNASPAVTNCTFKDNNANYGCAMYIYDNASPAVTNCTFKDNNANYDGGAMYIYNASPAITNCTFKDNNANYDGGAMNIYNNASPAITNCTFNGNTANYGGAMVIYNASPAITNCTFTGNKASNNGDEIYVGFDGTAELVNTIVNGYVVKEGNSTINADHCAFNSIPTDLSGSSTNNVSFDKDKWDTSFSADVTVSGVVHRVFAAPIEALGKASADKAPETDITGRGRKSNPDIGALETLFNFTKLNDGRAGEEYSDTLKSDTEFKLLKIDYEQPDGLLYDENGNISVTTYKTGSFDIALKLTYGNGFPAYVPATLSIAPMYGNGQTYNISNVSGLNALSEYVKANAGIDCNGITIKLNGDIKFDGSANNFTPVGKFAGTFDGNNHVISGIRCSNYSEAGLFAYVSGGTVRNVIIEDCEFITGTTAGGIAAHIDGGSIQNCAVIKSTVSADTSGGIVGSVNGAEDSVENCLSLENPVNGQTKGAIAGRNAGTVNRSYFRDCGDADAIGDGQGTHSNTGRGYTISADKTNPHVTLEIVLSDDVNLSNADTVQSSDRKLIFRGSIYTISEDVVTVNVNVKDGYSLGTFTPSGTLSGNKFMFTMPAQDVTVTAATPVINYTIGYELNGGTVATANPTGYNIESETITLTNPTKTGYTFIGWTGSADVTTSKDVTIKQGSTGNREYTATWTANTYSVSFNSNNGTGTTVSQNFTYDAEQALRANSFSRTGYNFTGWNTQADGKGTDYQDGQKVKNLTAESGGVVTLYAKWKVIEYTISYTLNSGTVEKANPTSYTVGDAITLSNPKRNGYNFDGWTGTGLTAKTQNVTIPKGSTGNRSYTANFTPIKYKITYNLDGGTNNPDNPVEYTIGSAIINLKAPTKEGYEFKGWIPEGVINKGSTGDKNFKANFVIIPVSDDVDSKDVDPTPTPEPVETTVDKILEMTSEDLKKEYGDTKNIALTLTEKVTNEQLSEVLEKFKEAGVEVKTLDLSQTTGLTEVKLDSSTSVENLKISGNQSIKTVEITGNATLKTLDLTDSKVEEVKVSNNKNLQTLDLTGSSVKEVEAKGCEKLETVNVEGSKTLEKLDVSETKITSLNVKDCAKLEIVKANSCGELEEVNLEGCESLKELDVSQTAVVALNAQNCENLEILNCASCDIRDLNIEGCKKLKVVKCNNNSLTRFNAYMFGSLQRLECNNQHVRDFKKTRHFNIIELLLMKLMNISTADENENEPETDTGDVANVKDIKAFDENGNEISVTFNDETGEVTFAQEPATITYNYITGFNDVIMDVTVSAADSSDGEFDDANGSGGGCLLVRSEGLGVRSVLILALFLLCFVEVRLIKKSGVKKP